MVAGVQDPLSNSTLLHTGNFHSKFMGNVFQWLNVGSFVRVRPIFILYLAERVFQVPIL